IQYYLTFARLHLKKEQLTDATTAINQAVSRAKSGYRQRLLAKSLVLQSQIQAVMGDKDTATTTWKHAEKLLTLLQMPKPNPNWLHVPPPTQKE
ncbi:MAG: hypothetical protein CUN56_15515, partial [Phototrophicales bacterium]